MIHLKFLCTINSTRLKKFRLKMDRGFSRKGPHIDYFSLPSTKAPLSDPIIMNVDFLICFL